VFASGGMVATSSPLTTQAGLRILAGGNAVDAALSTAAVVGVVEPIMTGAFVSELAVCTFCGKRAREVRKVIVGPDALICDECVDLCVEVLEEEIGEDWRSPDGKRVVEFAPGRVQIAA
jgi:hypothetical protein